MQPISRPTTRQKQCRTLLAGSLSHGSRPCAVPSHGRLVPCMFVQPHERPHESALVDFGEINDTVRQRRNFVSPLANGEEHAPVLQQSTINNQQSSINNQQSTINNQQSSIINHQSSIINHQSSIDNRQSSIHRWKKLRDSPRVF